MSGVLMALSFALATISLILNVSLNRGTNVNSLIPPFTPFNLTFQNTTVNPNPLRNLQTCASAIAANVPIVPDFNATINIVNITNNLTSYTGAIVLLNRGNLTVNNILPLNYTRQTLTIANSSIYYIQISDPMLYFVQNNSTNEFVFDNWNPLVYQNASGFEGIYDLLRMKIQSAPNTSIQPGKRDFIGTSMIMSRFSANLTVGDVVGITRSLQF